MAIFSFILMNDLLKNIIKSYPKTNLKKMFVSNIVCENKDGLMVNELLSMIEKMLVVSKWNEFKERTQIGE